MSSTSAASTNTGTRPKLQLYYLQDPSRAASQTVLVSHGLSESVSTNTILGLPFLRETHFIFIMAGDDDELLICQRIGAAFHVDYQVLLRYNMAATSAPDTHAAYPAMPKCPPTSPMTSRP
jgi:hypothetical protein